MNISVLVIYLGLASIVAQSDVSFKSNENSTGEQEPKELPSATNIKRLRPINLIGPRAAG